MNPIKVSNRTIIHHLNEHKDRFVESYGALLEEWDRLNKAYQEEYREYSQKVVDQTLTDEDKEPCRPRQPTDRTKDYDFYLNYVALDKNKDQELKEHDFRKFILDQWDWTHSHVASLGFYMDAADETGFASSSVATIRRAYQAYGGVLKL